MGNLNSYETIYQIFMNNDVSKNTWFTFLNFIFKSKSQKQFLQVSNWVHASKLRAE